MYATTRKKVEVLLRRSRKRGLPEWADVFVARAMHYAAAKRKRADEKAPKGEHGWKANCYRDAVLNLFVCLELLDLFLTKPEYLAAMRPRK